MPRQEAGKVVANDAALAVMHEQLDGMQGVRGLRFPLDDGEQPVGSGVRVADLAVKIRHLIIAAGRDRGLDVATLGASFVQCQQGLREPVQGVDLLGVLLDA